MSKRAQNEIRKRIEAAGQPSQIEQLCLDNINISELTPNIKKMIETCTRLEYLTLNDCSLRSLEHFPSLRNLIVLELSDNQISGQDLSRLRNAPAINFLTIDSNRIAQLSQIRALAALEDLQILQVHDNPVANNPDYRTEIFGMLPSIKAIDCVDRSGEKVREEDPSEYFSHRDPRSRYDLTDLIDDDEPGSGNTIAQHSRTAPDYLEEGREREPRSPRGSFYKAGRNLRRFQPELMAFRNPMFDSDSEEEQDPLRDFRKTIHRQE